jgi:hypothetical protein
MSAKALFEPMLCETAGLPREGPEWRYELKLDVKIEVQAQRWSRATERISFGGSPKSRIMRPARRRSARWVGKISGEDCGLGQGCYNKRIHRAPKNELIWGSYYLDAVLNVIAGLLEPTKV